MSTSNIKIKHLIIDMDGVLWRGDTPLPGLNAFFDTMAELAIGFVLATNNASKTAVQYVEKLARFGIELPANRILTSAEATAQYLSHYHPSGAKAYVVGESGLELAMQAYGFVLINSDGFVGAEDRADVVVVGMTREVCYRQLANAALLINHGAQFVGTNPDVTFPSEIGLLPGAGSLLAFLSTATGQQPLIIGKPNRGVFDEALKRLEAIPAETAMVGDRLNTDIAGGRAAGLKTILLMTGITRDQDLHDSEIKPDWIFRDLPALTEFLHKLSAK